MAQSPTRDDVLRKMLKTPPAPFTPKAKPKTNPVAKAKRKKATEKLVKKLDKGPLF